MCLGAPLCSEASNSCHGSTVCTGEGPRYRIRDYPCWKGFLGHQFTTLLALLEKWWPRAARGPAQSHRSQVLIGEEAPEATPSLELPEMLPLLVLWDLLPSLHHLACLGQWSEAELGAPCGGEDARSAMGVWWVFLGGRSWRDGRKWSK